jgi:hypothetical protein
MRIAPAGAATSSTTVDTLVTVTVVVLVPHPARTATKQTSATTQRKSCDLIPVSYLPARGRAPGWHAGIVIARRQLAAGCRPKGSLTCVSA